MLFSLEKVIISLFLIVVGTQALLPKEHNIQDREIHVPHPRLRRAYLEKLVPVTSEQPADDLLATVDPSDTSEKPVEEVKQVDSQSVEDKPLKETPEKEFTTVEPDYNIKVDNNKVDEDVEKIEPIEERRKRNSYELKKNKDDGKKEKPLEPETDKFEYNDSDIKEPSENVEVENVETETSTKAAEPMDPFEYSDNLPNTDSEDSKEKQPLEERKKRYTYELMKKEDEDKEEKPITSQEPDTEDFEYSNEELNKPSESVKIEKVEIETSTKESEPEEHVEYSDTVSEVVKEEQTLQERRRKRQTYVINKKEDEKKKEKPITSQESDTEKFEYSDKDLNKPSESVEIENVVTETSTKESEPEEHSEYDDNLSPNEDSEETKEEQLLEKRRKRYTYELHKNEEEKEEKPMSTQEAETDKFEYSDDVLTETSASVELEPTTQEPSEDDHFDYKDDSLTDPKEIIGESLRHKRYSYDPIKNEKLEELIVTPEPDKESSSIPTTIDTAVTEIIKNESIEDAKKEKEEENTEEFEVEDTQIDLITEGNTPETSEKVYTTTELPNDDYSSEILE